MIVSSEVILGKIFKNIWLSDLQLNIPTMTNEECLLYYQENVVITKEESINIILNTAYQNNDSWKNERSKRITGTTCYHQLYTYSKNKAPNWNKKVMSITNRHKHVLKQ